MTRSLKSGTHSRRTLAALVAALLATAAAVFLATVAAASPPDGPATLASVAVASDSAGRATSYDGVVEAVRQTVVSAQVPGAVVTLNVKPGDRVREGQVLLRLDARAAEQQAGAATAQIAAARAAEEMASKELERQKQLFKVNFISQAALDRAEAQFRATSAQAAAQRSVAGAAHAESSFYTVKAPYDGVVSEVPVVLGDMAMPGRALLTMYDPAALRVTAAVPESAAPRGADTSATPEIELPGATPARIAAPRWQLLPAVDPTTHTVQLRLDLPAGLPAAPGTFARAWLRSDAGEGARLSVPARAVVRRAELTAVYVVGDDGRPLLRQVRLGPANGERVEVLSGLRAGERVALDPQAAARRR